MDRVDRSEDTRFWTEYRVMKLFTLPATQSSALIGVVSVDQATFANVPTLDALQLFLQCEVTEDLAIPQEMRPVVVALTMRPRARTTIVSMDRLARVLVSLCWLLSVPGKRRS